MKNKSTPLISILATSLLVLPSLAANAAESEDKNEDISDSEVIIITGTPGGSGIRKSDAPFAVTNLDAKDLEKLSPKSTADLLKSIPGVWSESSGGTSGANVFVRGFPGGGDAPFLTISVEGTPIFPAPTLSFLENTSLFRIDETISMVEGLRGGPNPVVSNGQPGLTTNFRLKRGSDIPESLGKYTTTDFGQHRIDLVTSGPISEDFYYMFGGYVSTSPGIRDAGFTSEKGHQFTLHLTKLFESGEFNFWTRQTDDHGVWYLPTPLNVAGVGPEYTQIGINNRQATITYGANNEEDGFDFGNGRGWKGNVSGGNFSVDLGNNWSLIDRFSYTKGAANTYGFVPNGSATTLDTVADNGISAAGMVTRNIYNGETPVQQMGRWVVLKDIESFVNDLALSKELDQWNINLGVYHASTSASDWWSLGNHAYYVLEPGGEMLDGVFCNFDPDGCGWNYDIESTGDARTFALYTTINYQLNDQWDFDFGLRREQHEVAYTVDEGLTGVVSKFVDYDESKTSYTAGFNYKLASDKGLFGRINRGYKMPYFDDFRDNYGAFESGDPLIKEVTQFEFGYKFFTPSLNFYSTLFNNKVEGDTFTRFPGAPSEILTNEATGVEIDATYSDDTSGFEINFNGTIQDTEITKSPTNEGNEAQRQPGWQIRITPSYEFEITGGEYLTLYGNLFAVDDRFSDNENTVVLDSYNKFDLGMIYEPNDKFSIQLAVDNLTDEEGLTEGDPRNPTSPNGRYILPRSIKLSLSYVIE